MGGTGGGKNWVLLCWAGPCSVKSFMSFSSATCWWMGLHSLPGSFLAWGDPALRSKGSMVVSMARLMATSKRVYAKGDLPRLLLPVFPSLWWAPANPRLQGGPPTLAGSFRSLLWGHCSFPLSLGAARFCLWPPRLESLFSSVLWKSCNQVPLAFKIRYPGDSWSVRSSSWEAWSGAQNLPTVAELLWYYFSSVCGSPGRHGIWSWLCPSYSLAVASCLWMWGFFFW